MLRSGAGLMYAERKAVRQGREINQGGKEDADARCTKCQGEGKDRFVKGLTIIWDLDRDGARWSGGRILDLEDGKVYKCRNRAVDGGNKLEVRGSVAIFSKTQTWTSLE
jgi:uncharacterized protein (DUF2147 family)